jgi:predicted CoA-binding protein
MKKTLVIGASENTERYSNRAMRMLQQFHHPVVALGLKSGQVGNVPIRDAFHQEFEGVHTVTLYVSAKNQDAYKALIMNLKPKRVIFNPGTENPQFMLELQDKGIASEESCTLVLLSLGSY